YGSPTVPTRCTATRSPGLNCANTRARRASPAARPRDYRSTPHPAAPRGRGGSRSAGATTLDPLASILRVRRGDHSPKGGYHRSGEFTGARASAHPRLDATDQWGNSMQRRDFIKTMAAAGATSAVGRYAHAAPQGWREFEIAYSITLKDAAPPARLWVPVP